MAPLPTDQWAWRWLQPTNYSCSSCSSPGGHGCPQRCRWLPRARQSRAIPSGTASRAFPCTPFPGWQHSPAPFPCRDSSHSAPRRGRQASPPSLCVCIAPVSAFLSISTTFFLFLICLWHTFPSALGTIFLSAGQNDKLKIFLNRKTQALSFNFCLLVCFILENTPFRLAKTFYLTHMEKIKKAISLQISLLFHYRNFPKQNSLQNQKWKWFIFSNKFLPFSLPKTKLAQRVQALSKLCLEGKIALLLTFFCLLLFFPIFPSNHLPVPKCHHSYHTKLSEKCTEKFTELPWHILLPEYSVATGHLRWLYFLWGTWIFDILLPFFPSLIIIILLFWNISLHTVFK